MSTLLTYISVKDGKIKRSSLEVLSRCVELADEHVITTQQQLSLIQMHHRIPTS